VRAQALALDVVLDDSPGRARDDEHHQKSANLMEESMLIEIRAKEFGLTDGIRLHIERRLEFALNRFAQRIRVIRVCVGDINGPRHGAHDKCCRLAIRLAHRVVVLEERAADLYEAIDRAAHRVRMVVSRAMRRRKRHALPEFLAM
jgi:putative sigma-54 modulation protein